jgi:hypothetical protein
MATLITVSIYLNIVLTLTHKWDVASGLSGVLYKIVVIFEVQAKVNQCLVWLEAWVCLGDR